MLQKAFRSTDESRYQHRLHGVLLVMRGMGCAEVAVLLGDSTRTVQSWVQRFQSDGLAGLQERERAGRPARLSDKQLVILAAVLREPPSAVGLTSRDWDGKTVARFIEKRWNTELGQRQCQRLFRRLRPLLPVRNYLGRHG